MAGMSDKARYRLAAEEALGQLDLCIRYLHGIRKYRIATQLAKNSRFIRNNLLREPMEGG